LPGLRIVAPEGGIRLEYVNKTAGQKGAGLAF
jgi:hypothetical protein